MRIVSALISLLLENLIFVRALGTSTMLAATKSRSNLAVLALLMTLFSTLTCFLTGVVFSLLDLRMLLEHPWSLGLPLVYTLVIAVIYLTMLPVMLAVLRKRFSSLKKYVHLSAFNCAVMGTLYLASGSVQLLGNVSFPGGGYAVSAGFHPLGAALFGLQQGMGFLLAALMVSAVRERLYDKEVPAAFRGFPAVMVYIGLISMAIYAIQN